MAETEGDQPGEAAGEKGESEAKNADSTNASSLETAGKKPTIKKSKKNQKIKKS